MEKILWRRKFNEVTAMVGQRSELYLRGGKGGEGRGEERRERIARLGSFPRVINGAWILLGLRTTWRAN